MTEQHYPSIKQGFALILWYLLVTMATALVLLPLGIDPASDSSLVSFAYYTIAMGFLALLGLKKADRLVPISGDFRKMKWWVWLLILLLIPLHIIVVEPLISLIPMPEFFREMFEDLMKRDLFTFLSLVIAAPILEEFIFRGIVLEGFLKNYEPKKAIIWSAVIFGAIHLNPWQFIGAGILGFYIGWIYYRTRSLIPCIVLHFLNNLLAYLIFYFFPEIESFQELSPSLMVTLAVLLGAIASIILIIKTMDKGLPEVIISVEEENEALNATNQHTPEL